MRISTLQPAVHGSFQEKKLTTTRSQAHEEIHSKDGFTKTSRLEYMKDTYEAKIKQHIHHGSEIGKHYVLADHSMPIQEAMIRLGKDQRLTYHLGFQKKSDGTIVMKSKDNKKTIVHKNNSKQEPYELCTQADMSQLRVFFETQYPIFSYKKQGNRITIQAMGKDGTVDIVLDNTAQLEGFFSKFPAAYKVIAKDILHNLHAEGSVKDSSSSYSDMVEMVMRQERIKKGRVQTSASGGMEIVLENEEKVKKGSWSINGMTNELKGFLKSIPGVKFVQQKVEQITQQVRQVVEKKTFMEHRQSLQSLQSLSDLTRQQGELGDLYRMFALPQVKNAIKTSGLHGTPGLQKAIHIAGFRPEMVWIIEAMRGIHLHMSKHQTCPSMLQAALKGAFKRCYPRTTPDTLEVLLDHSLTMLSTLRVDDVYMPKVTHLQTPSYGEASFDNIAEENKQEVEYHAQKQQFKKAHTEIKEAMVVDDRARNTFERALDKGISWIKKWF